MSLWWLMFYHHKLSLFISSNLLVSLSYIFKLSIATSASKWLLFHMFFHLFLMNLFISLTLNCISWTVHLKYFKIQNDEVSLVLFKISFCFSTFLQWCVWRQITLYLSYLAFKFLGLEINIFNQILDIFSYYFFEYFSVTLVDGIIPFSWICSPNLRICE